MDWNFFYQFRRHTAHNCILRNILCHNCSGRDHSAVSYADSLCNDLIAPDPIQTLLSIRIGA